MLKPHVLGRGKDPPGRLQLVNLPHPLHPRMVDNRLLGHLARRQPRFRDEGNVPVNRIVREAFLGEVADHVG